VFWNRWRNKAAALAADLSRVEQERQKVTEEHKMAAAESQEAAAEAHTLSMLREQLQKDLASGQL
jgi:hypothetical protein